MRQRSADRDPLLLAARELAGGRLSPLVREAHALEQLVGAPVASRPVGARKPELQPDELARRKVGVERARVVLLHVAQLPRPVLREPAAAQLPDLLPEDGDDARRGIVRDPERMRAASTSPSRSARGRRAPPAPRR